MSNPMRAESKEPIPGETWCIYCKVPVDEWIVEFVEDSEGYFKVHRCPNCNKKSFNNSGYGNFTLVLFIVGVVLWVGGFHAWFVVTGEEIIWEGKGDQASTHTSVLCGGAIVFGFVFTLFTFPLYKKYIRRHGPKGQPKKPPRESS